MFLDTSFNSLNTVLGTIYENFIEAAMKYYRYAKSMPKGQQPRNPLLIGTPASSPMLLFTCFIKGSVPPMLRKCLF